MTRRPEIDPAKVPVRKEAGGFSSRFLNDRMAVFALIFIILVTALSIMAPLFTPYGRDDIDLERIMEPYSPGHILGTDYLGRDVFTRLLYGGRFSLLVALGSVSIAVIIGVVLGSLSGFFGGWVDSAVTMIIDMYLSIPIFLVLLVAASVLGGSIWSIPIVIGSVSWMETARVSRAKIQSVRKSGFVEASLSMGERNWLIIIKHVIPYIAAPVVVSATIGFANAMLVESALSFLGFGVGPPVPTWGNMLDNARVALRSVPVSAFAPGLMIFMTCLCFNLVGRAIKNSLSYFEEEL